MKNILILLMAVAAVNLSAAPQSNTPQPNSSWLDSISLAPVGALKTEHLDGPSQWGAGVRVGYDVNPFVSLNVVNLAFEGPGQYQRKVGGGKGDSPDCYKTSGPNSWGGSAVDETLFQVDSKISYFSTEKVSLHLVGGAQTDWNDHNWGVNVGAKLVLDFTKRFGAEGGYTIQTWFKGQTKVDSLVTAALNFRL